MKYSIIFAVCNVYWLVWTFVSSLSDTDYTKLDQQDFHTLPAHNTK